MRELVVLSGKGGTGKTSLVGSLAALAERKVLVDCDVDAANLHLIVEPEIRQRQQFISGKKAVINNARCTGCGLCLVHCRFDAIIQEETDSDEEQYRFRCDPLRCEGCGVCAYVCPEDTIEMRDNVSGEWYVSNTRYGPMVHGHLGIAEGNSGKLVSLLRERARSIAHEKNLDLIIVDGPPGIGCPVIASLTGADYVLIVTEPSLSALHDLKRLLQLVGHFKIPAGLCINKADINPSVAGQIKDYASQQAVRLLAEIAYDSTVTESQAAGKTMIEYIENDSTRQIRSLWTNLRTELSGDLEDMRGELRVKT